MSSWWRCDRRARGPGRRSCGMGRRSAWPAWRTRAGGPGWSTGWGMRPRSRRVRCRSVPDAWRTSRRAGARSRGGRRALSGCRVASARATRPGGARVRRAGWRRRFLAARPRFLTRSAGRSEPVTTRAADTPIGAGAYHTCTGSAAASERSVPLMIAARPRRPCRRRGRRTPTRRRRSCRGAAPTPPPSASRRPRCRGRG